MNPESVNEGSDLPNNLRIEGLNVYAPKKNLIERPTLCEDSRNQLSLFAQLKGYEHLAHGSVMPTGPYLKYSTVFMSAMQPELQWLYQGEVPESVRTSVGTSFCIRTNKNFQNSGKSARNLKCFEMLNISGRMTQEQLLNEVHQLLLNQLDGSGTVLSMKAHPDDLITKEFCKSVGLECAEDEKSVFSEPDKTDRIGVKAEWFGSRKVGKETIDFELMDMLAIHSLEHGRRKISPPLVEAGGSFERVLALREGVSNVLMTSAFDVEGIRRIDGSLTLEKALALQDLIRALLVMSGSGYELPATKRDATKQEKVYSVACHEMAVVCLENGVAIDVLGKCMEHDLGHMKTWKNAGYDLANFDAHRCATDVAEAHKGLVTAYQNTVRYLKAHRNSWPQDELMQKAADKYFGGTLRLVQIAVRDL